MARQIERINDSTYRIEDEFVRFFVLIGDDKTAVIDSGVTGAGIVELVRTITDKELILINTHGDGDHCAGTSEFEEIKISEDDYYNCKLNERFASCKVSFINEGDIIDIGGRKLEIIEIPGHTKGSVAILDIDNKMLFPGDSVQTGNIFMFGDHRDVSVFGESLRKLISRKNDYEYIYPSHDTPELPKDYAEKVLEDWMEYLDGKIEGFDIDVHGNKVKCFKGKNCGFLV